jgi:hypothetical protein
MIDVRFDQMVWWDAPSEDSQAFRFILTYAQSSSEVIPAANPDAVLERLQFCRNNDERKDVAMFTRCRFSWGRELSNCHWLPNIPLC